MDGKIGRRPRVERDRRPWYAGIVPTRVSSPRSSLQALLSRPSSSSRRVLLTLSSAALLPLALTGCNHASAGTKIATASPRRSRLPASRWNSSRCPRRRAIWASIPSRTGRTPTSPCRKTWSLCTSPRPTRTRAASAWEACCARGRAPPGLNVRVSDLPASLNAVPGDAWPYGRVVAIEEAHDTPALQASRRPPQHGSRDQDP